MLLGKRSPGPPWLPIPHFADRATVCVGRLSQPSFVLALAMVDRGFSPVSVTAWTLDGTFGLRLGEGGAVVPSGAEWWCVSLGFIGARPPLPPAGDLVRVRWRLHL